jgi:hypothetical protein
MHVRLFPRAASSPRGANVDVEMRNNHNNAQTKLKTLANDVTAQRTTPVYNK